MDQSISSVKKATICSLCIALCSILPIAFHAIGAGAIFTPMHFPIVLCGLICGPFYGAFCGLAGPLISSSLTGMPTMISMLYFAPEVMTYGFICGLIMNRVHTGNLLRDLYIAMIPAMILGRIVGGIAEALFYIYSLEQPFTIGIWATAYFLRSLPGILLQLVAIPPLIVALERSKLIPRRYIKKQGAAA